jgi:hypothetical protein
MVINSSTEQRSPHVSILFDQRKIQHCKKFVKNMAITLVGKHPLGLYIIGGHARVILYGVTGHQEYTV